MSAQGELKRHLGFKEIFAIAAGAMISSGLFVLPAIIYKDIGKYTALAYILATVFMIPTLLVKMELVTAMPKAGGDYFYIERGLGGIIGILGGLANWFTLSLKSAFALIGIGGFLELFVHDFTYNEIKIVALVSLGIIFLLNILSVKIAAKIEIVLVYILLSILFLYVITGATHIHTEYFKEALHIGLKDLLKAGGMVFISFGGLTQVASIAEEAKRPAYTVPRGMIFSFVVVSILYFLAVLITIGLLSPSEFKATLEPLSHGGEKIAGKFGLFVVSIAAMTAFVTTANAGILAASRTPLAMAKDGLLPPVFARLHPKFDTPFISIIITGTFMAVSILFFNLKELVKTASTVMLVLFITVHISYMVIRGSNLKNYSPVFKAPLFPWLSIGAILLYGFLIFELGTDMELFVLFFATIAIILYFLYSRKNIRKRSVLIHLIEKAINREIASSHIEDELKEIVRERDKATLDRFDVIIKKSPVIDINKTLTQDEFFKIAARQISTTLNVDENMVYKELCKREEEASTVIVPQIAIPHLIIEGNKLFTIIPFRAINGIRFNNGSIVKAGFILAGTRDERNFHLTALMAIAEIVGDKNFLKKILRAKTEDEIKRIIMKSRKRRII